MKSSGFNRYWIVALASIVAASLVTSELMGSTSAEQIGEQPNVVFIAIEDTSPQRLGCYGGPVQSPNIDSLAKEGLLFRYAYCTTPLCNPSRTALLTGLRPNTTGVFTNRHDWRKMKPGIVTMPMHFRNHGYDTIRIGKIYHGKWEHEASWSRVIPERHNWLAAIPRRLARSPEQLPQSDDKSLFHKLLSLPIFSWLLRYQDRLKWGPTGNHPEDDLDGQIAEQAVRFLKQEHARPFFLAIGFSSPHLPFRAPDRFHALYPVEEIQCPQLAQNDLKDTIQNNLYDYGRTTEKECRELISSHYATISYVDWCVGKVLDALRETSREQDTILVLWSDHGFMLGEHFLWGKWHLYEHSARVAFIWKVPGVTPAGVRCDRPVETIDTFPTLFDLCGIPQPEPTEGISMRSLLENPSRPWKKGAISWRSDGKQVAIQTEQYRLNKQLPNGFLEVYDRAIDPGELSNIADNPKYANDISWLKRLLDGGWKACLPDDLKVP